MTTHVTTIEVPVNVRDCMAELDALAATPPRNVPWSDGEVETVRKYYGKVPAATIADALNRHHHKGREVRSGSAVMLTAGRHGITARSNQ